MIDLSSIENIIFDLGGVIIDVDEQLSIDAFKNLGAIDIDEDAETQEQFTGLSRNFEKGVISPHGFCIELSQILNLSASYGEIIEAWNTCLLDIPGERTDILLELSKKYNLYLCSNTNEFHLAHIFEQERRKFKQDLLFPFFEKEYYSFNHGMRKPEPDFYNMILKENKLNPQNTLFVDDRTENIEAAIRAGLKSFHVKQFSPMEKIFSSAII